MRRAFINAKLFDGDNFQFDKCVLVDDGIITDIVSVDSVPDGYERFDVANKILSPAFIDLQIYGGNGKMFSHETQPASIDATREYCAAGGAAYFMITVATNSQQKFLEAIDAVQEYWNAGGQGCLGLHLEGPFLNPVKKGAHIEGYIRKPDRHTIDELLNRGRDVVKMMTLAPEQCDTTYIRQLRDAGIIVSAGHTDATYQQAMDAFDSGVPVATHLFNAMSSLMHRQPGMVGAIFDHPTVKSSIVCDGIHVKYPAVRIAHKLMQQRLFFITDAVTEVKEGAYIHLLKDDHYALPDGTLSGSSLTMLKCVYNAVNHARIPPEVALSMATSIPASVLGDTVKIGRIEKGYDAKFCLMDESFESVKIL